MSQGHLRLVATSRTGDSELDNRPDDLRVLLVENHTPLRKGMAAILHSSSGIEVSEERINPDVILARIKRWEPDVISLAVQLDGEGGLGLLDRVLGEAPGAAVVVLTMQRSAAFAQRALRRGARGVVLKDHADSELIPAVHAAALRETYVSPLIALG